jgi:hypothetical protein
VVGASGDGSRVGSEQPGSVRMAARQLSLAAYLAVGIALALFGYLALFSIGFPFLLTGVLMLALTPVRRRAAIIVPTLLWPWVFTIGYLLVAPLGCTTFTMPRIAGGVRDSVEGSTRCHALFFTYAGDALYNPPIWPALLVGVVFATGVALIARRWLAHRAIQTGTKQRVR